MNTLIRPRRDLASVQEEFMPLFRSLLGDDPVTAGAFAPALDVEETEEGFTLHVDLPGVAPDDVDVSLEENVLTVRGTRTDEEGRSERLRRSERRFGAFHRSVRLPDRVAVDSVEADYRNGVLTIVVPKAEEAKPRRIEVRAS